MSDISTDTPADTPAVEETASTNPSLQITDLIAVVQLIAAVTQRGAIQAAELSQVGGLYDRFVAFLEANGAVKKADSAAPIAPAQETTE